MYRDANSFWLFSNILLVYSFNYVYLQTTTVSGVVRNIETKAGIAEVRIFEVHKAGHTSQRGKTDSNGNFAISVPHGSKALFKFQHPDYFDEERELEASTVYTITMEQRPTKIPAGPVTGTGSRTRLGAGSINRDSSETSESKSNDGMTDNEAIGVGIGVLLFVVMVAVIAACAFLKRRKKKGSEEQAAPADQADQPTDAPPADAPAEGGDTVAAGGQASLAGKKSGSLRSPSKSSAVGGLSKRGSASVGASQMVSADGGGSVSNVGAGMVSADDGSFGATQMVSADGGS